MALASCRKSTAFFINMDRFGMVFRASPRQVEMARCFEQASFLRNKVSPLFSGDERRYYSEAEKPENDENNGSGKNGTIPFEVHQSIVSQKDQEIGTLRSQLETMKGMVGAVGGRGVVDKFFALHVKSYLPEKAPGTSYTTSQIRKAYEDFFNDENNQIAVDFVSYFPNKTSREIAEIYVKLFGKLSWYDHTLFEALLRSQKYEAFVDCIKFIPAVISIDEKKNLEVLARIFLKFNEEWKDYNYKM